MGGGEQGWLRRLRLKAHNKTIFIRLKRRTRSRRRKVTRRPSPAPRDAASWSTTRSVQGNCLKTEYFCFKLSERVTDIDKKMLEVSERLNLMIDKQEQIMELHTKYR